jgi:HPt (histidine-containing phosphotransfer) domain-containing protein
VTGQSTSVQAIRSALEAGDIETALRLAHTLKGVSATIGATEIPPRAEAVERAIRERHAKAALESSLNELEQPLAALIQALQAWLVPQATPAELKA